VCVRVCAREREWCKIPVWIGTYIRKIIWLKMRYNNDLFMIRFLYRKPNLGLANLSWTLLSNA
jgi:hypothetical protein